VITPETYRARMALHKAHILSLMPSIIVLEEVDNTETAPDQYSLPADIIGTCSEAAADPAAPQVEYQGIHGQKMQSGKDQTWVIFDAKTLCLLETPSVIEMPNGANQFAILCVFQQIDGEGALQGDPFALVAQHCKAGRTEESESLRIAHSQFLLGELARRAPHLIATHQRLIWVGDFNAGPHSYGGKYPARWYRQVIQSRPPESAETGGNDWVNGIVPLVSAYLAGSGEEPEMTTYKMREGKLISQTIDYIFIARLGGFSVKAVLDPAPEKSMPETLPSLPFWGSDHLSICADVSV
jgi:hypothetical protein